MQLVAARFTEAALLSLWLVLVPGDTPRFYPEDLWHPYTPFQMSPVDSNDWTRMRKAGWKTKSEGLQGFSCADV